MRAILLTKSSPAGADFLENSTWPGSFTYIEKLGYITDGIIPLVIEGFSIAIDDNRRLRCYSDQDIQYVSEWWEQFEESCDYKLTTSVNAETEMGAIAVFPNPFRNFVTVKPGKKNAGTFSIKVIDMTGKTRLLLKDQTIKQRFELNLKNLEAGTYFLNITNQENRSNQTFTIKKL